jgi:hypothetical protein
MKKLLVRFLLCVGIVLASLTAGNAEESHRGFFEADLSGGGKAVFFVQGNHAISVYVFDVSTSTASFAGGDVAADGSFSLTASNGATIAGIVKDDDSVSGSDDDLVTATVAGQSVTATRVPTFGPSDDIPGRFSGTAASTGGSSYEVKLVIDSQNRIYFIAINGGTVVGGFGSVSVAPHTTIAAQMGADDPPGDDNGGGGGGGSDDPPGHDFGDDHGQDDDFVASFDEDLNDDHPAATFALTLLSGESVTGSLTFGHGTQLGEFTLNGETFFFNAPQESPANHLANISTRGFVNTGQGQLIGGFIITGGPKMVLIRALGPSLAAQGVTPALQNPVLKLIGSDGVSEIRSNDDWQSASNAADIISTTIPPQDASESSILVRLEPGAYTAIVTGANDATGIALIEVYEIDRD